MATFILRNVDSALWARMNALLAARPEMPVRDYIVNALAAAIAEDEAIAATASVAARVVKPKRTPTPAVSKKGRVKK